MALPPIDPKGFAGAGMAGTAPAPKVDFEITHIEIRRLQNGFVLAGINMDVYHRYVGGQETPQRVSYVAKDAAELGALIEWFITGKEIGWLPTVNLPVFDMVHRPGLSTQELKDAVKEGIREAAPPPIVFQQPNQMTDGQIFGGPLIGRAKGIG